jgi:hypothetical protein
MRSKIRKHSQTEVAPGLPHVQLRATRAPRRRAVVDVCRFADLVSGLC